MVAIKLKLVALSLLYLATKKFTFFQNETQYLVFLITTDVELDGSIDNNTMNISVNIAKGVVGYWTNKHDITYLFIDGGPPLMAYLAACSLSTQSTYATLDLQAGTLSSNLSQESSQFWKLWSPGTNESNEFISWVGYTYVSSNIVYCLTQFIRLIPYFSIMDLVSAHRMGL